MWTDPELWELKEENIRVWIVTNENRKTRDKIHFCTSFYPVTLGKIRLERVEEVWRKETNLSFILPTYMTNLEETKQ